MSRIYVRLAVVLGVLAAAGSVFAALLGVGSGVSLGYPRTTYTGAQESTTYAYTAGNPSGVLTITAILDGHRWSSSTAPVVPSNGTLALSVTLGPTGALIPGDPGSFVVSGSVSDNGTTYTSPLLTGRIVGFGFQNVGAYPASDRLDFRFEPTGGTLLPFYAGRDVGVTATLENSRFEGSFAPP
jgi:hypothetical protein